MKHEVQLYLELLERRLTTLRMLATDLDESRSAYVTLDLRSMHQHISRQENLCTEIRMLDTELQNMKEKLRGLAASGEMPATLGELEAQLDPMSARQLHLLLGGLKAIQADVRRLSRVHSELLRRSRRSVNVLLNFLAHYSGRYPVPAPRSKGMPVA
ncbi:MAG TPA: flagellar export chaperone FlgN [Terriglobia bacterium]|nr:flagellar export chaperone FlgN [Terriglobia bacterium]